MTRIATNRRPYAYACARPLASPLRVLFTLDVETRLDRTLQEDVWGASREGGQSHGLEYMLDAMDRYGVKATFFLNVYETALWGEGPMRQVVHLIQRRGHDIGLHTHPKPMHGTWGMCQVDYAKQVSLMRSGLDLLHRFGVPRVMAHRAGAWAANLDTVRACQAAGIPMDFSHNPTARDCDLGRELLTTNAAFELNGVLCVPLTCHRQMGLGPWESLRVVDMECSSPSEIFRVADRLRRHGVQTMTLLLHSFSLNRSGEVNTRIRDALEELLQHFSSAEGYEIVTAGQLYDHWKDNPQLAGGSDFLPTTGYRLMLQRAWQRRREGWKNWLLGWMFSPVLATMSACKTLYRSIFRLMAGGSA